MAWINTKRMSGIERIISITIAEIIKTVIRTWLSTSTAITTGRITNMNWNKIAAIRKPGTFSLGLTTARNAAIPIIAPEAPTRGTDSDVLNKILEATSKTIVTIPEIKYTERNLALPTSASR